MFLPREGFCHINHYAAGQATYNARKSVLKSLIFIASDKITKFCNEGAVLHSEIIAGCLIHFRDIRDFNFENTSELKKERC